MDITLITRFADSRIGGIGTYSELIHDGLKNRDDVNLNLITQENSILPYTDNPLKYFFYSFFELKWILNKKTFKNSDVFHAVSPMEAICANKSKTVVTIHDVYDIDKYKSIPEKIMVKSIKESIKCEKIILDKKESLVPLRKYGEINEEDIHIIGPAISSRFHPQAKENDLFTVGTIARLDSRKRNDLLIKSFLEANIENSQLLIGGTGPEMENLKKIAGNDERIKFLGFIPDEEVNNFYNSLDVFVFPTLFEGYGMPIVEAMGCKKPVITLDDAEITEDVKKRTFVCSKEELGDVLRDKTFKCNIKENYDFFKDHNIEKRINQIIKVYESI